MNVKLKKLLTIDWEIIAGLIAAISIIVLKFLHIVHADTMLTLAIVLLAGLFIREIRRESKFEEIVSDLNKMQIGINLLSTHADQKGVTLISPSDMKEVTESFGKRASGIVVFKHISPHMFKRKEHFELYLKPVLENESVTEIIFIIDANEKDDYERYIKEKIKMCENNEKVVDPIISENLDANGVIASSCGLNENSESLVTFFGEPFMVKYGNNWVPKYALHVLPDSDLSKVVLDNIRKYTTFS